MSEIRVALIESQDLSRYGMQAALGQSDLITVVGEAAKGREGLDLLQQTQPDLVIIELDLPDISGIEVIQQIKNPESEAESADLKVLIFSTEANEELVMQAFAAGADSYCLKDKTNHQDLLEAIEATYQGNSWLDPAIARIVLSHYQQTIEQDTNDSSPGSVSIEPIDPAVGPILGADPLTKRELEILELIVGGHKNEEISQKLYITLDTVKTHVRNILNKMGASDRTHAAVLGLRSGLVN
ncbi:MULTISPECIES: response regulator transcription factor [Trichocoleus]|uniref:Response regulator transcription factor n=1 Tax=Trichocoleus desertorum GB2-A4 TaxID=2933944 RepID=A0ABV0JAL8_9CYAN|nr:MULTISPECIES: response regulator transcription factor [unclassified Trichocoleus]MBD1863069.1 response regulator transcription factor [Trichocoleus sp. FACHB-46]MBD2120832.1 response regulator transcription factor [Trichocoleus sp. FACHB-262]